jgi:hypothetical protein
MRQHREQLLRRDLARLVASLAPRAVTRAAPAGTIAIPYRGAARGVAAWRRNQRDPSPHLAESEVEG